MIIKFQTKYVSKDWFLNQHLRFNDIWEVNAELFLSRKREYFDSLSLFLYKWNVTSMGCIMKIKLVINNNKAINLIL